MISEERKAQMSRAKRKYRFKQMLQKRIDQGARFMHKPDVLIDGFMSAPWAKEMTPKVFLNMYCLEDAPDTQEDRSFSIPIDTNQEELVALLARFFNQREVHPNGIKRTVEWLLYAMGIKPSLEDLPTVIGETLKEERANTSEAAKAILDGLRAYGRYTDEDVLKTLDKIACMINNPDDS